MACQLKTQKQSIEPKDFIEIVIQETPSSLTKDKLEYSLNFDTNTSTLKVALELGNGSTVLTQDTVPFVIWSAANYLTNFEESLWQTVSALGDRDTTCAMVGAIVSSYLGLESIPKHWFGYRTDFEKFIN